MCLIFNLVIFLTIILFESIVGYIVTVGDYNQLNTKTCGLSRHSLGVEYHCLKWHKDDLSPIKGARNVSLGDAPWITLIKFSRPVQGIGRDNGSCTGSLIADQWILTAAHCVAGAIDIKIHFGYNFSEETPSDAHAYDPLGVFIHPDYDASDPTAPHAYDIALVNIGKVNFVNTNRTLVNSICVPERWSGTDCKFKPTPNCNEKEIVMIAGWGSGYVSYYPPPTNLQIGYWKLFNERYDLSNDQEHEKMKSKMAMHQMNYHTVCIGDSGGPVWQYYMGRAVIVGVLTDTAPDIFGPDKGCTTEPPEWGVSQSSAVWVDQVIDWIQDITKLY